MPVNSEQREQFYLESGQLRLRNIYAKWQVSVTSNVEVSVTSSVAGQCDVISGGQCDVISGRSV